MIPKFQITPELVQAYARMFDVPMSDKEQAEMPGQLSGGFEAISQLWEVDVTGFEPAVILPVDRSAQK